MARRDSAGIEIVTSTPKPDAAPTRAFDSLPLFDIGADQSDPHQEFQRPTNPIRLSDGRIVVGDHGTNEIRFYDSTGRWLNAVGRKGSGPGEFEDLAMVFLGPADSLYAIEPGNGRVSVLDHQGRFGRTFAPAIDLLTPAADGSVWLREYVVDPDGPTRYSVVDTSGALTDFIVGPAKFRPTWIGAQVALGIWLGEDDVAHVRAYRLRPRSR